MEYGDWNRSHHRRVVDGNLSSDMGDGGLDDRGGICGSLRVGDRGTRPRSTMAGLRIRVNRRIVVRRGIVGRIARRFVLCRIVFRRFATCRVIARRTVIF